MADTDTLFKLFIKDFMADFAAWVLNTDIAEVVPAPTNLPSDAITADQVSWVTLADGRSVLFHIEFQGPSSRPAMRWRMLHYMTRLAVNYQAAVASVVFYVGHGAGASDTGSYNLISAVGNGSLTWKYQVVRLWEWSAEDLLALNHPVLSSLVGLTRITEPAVVLPEAVAHIKTVPDSARQARLVSTFLTLLEEEELIQMVERLIEKESIFPESPYLRRVRAESHDAGREAGREEGQRTGAIIARQDDIIRIIEVRFAPDEAAYHALKERVANIADLSQLDDLFTSALQADNLEAFEASLHF